MARRPSEEKPKRIPINGNRNHFSSEGLDTDNFHYCWVNDMINNSDDNISKYLEAGYEFTYRDSNGKDTTTDPDRGSSLTNMKISKAVGVNRTAYLMRVPLAIYEQDLAEYHDKIDANEEEWKNRSEGQYGKIEVDNGSRYRK
jgi:hypothetical protein